LLHVLCSAFLPLGFIDRPNDFIFWELNKAIL
jgi:hypothetical protein